MKRKFLFFLLLLVLLLPAADLDSDVESFLFLSPRTTGLGMAGVCLGPSPESVFLNPALLAQHKKINTYVASYLQLDDITNIQNGRQIFPGRLFAYGSGPWVITLLKKDSGKLRQALFPRLYAHFLKPGGRFLEIRRAPISI